MGALIVMGDPTMNVCSNDAARGCAPPRMSSKPLRGFAPYVSTTVRGWSVRIHRTGLGRRYLAVRETDVANT